jgi:uncharacterized protein YkwD
MAAAAAAVALAVALTVTAAGGDPAAYGDPTAAEQYMLELINAMRADPDGAAAAYGIDLNECLNPGTISSVPAQPLTMNEDLLAAARKHTRDMYIRDFFDHLNPDGLLPSDRCEAEGYSRFVGENLALATVNGRTETEGVEYLLQLLFVDAGVPNRGHRVNLLRPTFSEAGLGFDRGLYETWDCYLTTQNFGSDNGPFVTGVCYSDMNGNDAYDPGEGLAGVLVTADGNHTTTGTAGGYAVPVSGSFSVTALGSGIDSIVGGLSVTTENVKVDFTPLGIPNGPPMVDAGADQAVELPNSAVLAGAASDDGNPDPPGALTTAWSVTSGPGNVTFLDSSSVETTASFSASGTYVLRLTASDGALSSYAELTVTVTGVAGNGGDDGNDDGDDPDDSDSGGGCFIRSARGRSSIIQFP